jgi:CHAD domain-containing protein
VPIEAVAGARIRSVYRRMVRDGGRIADDSDPEALHDLRKRGKELRYLLELFGSPFPNEVVKPMISTLKDLQDVLGRFQDRAVQAEELRGLADDLAAEPGGPAALLALGPVLDAVLADQRAARLRFAEAFAPFAASEQRRLVRDTFPKRADP